MPPPRRRATRAREEDGVDGRDTQPASDAKRRPTSAPTPASSATAAVDASPISFLTGLASAATFWNEHFEAGPRLYKATPTRTAWVKNLPTTASLVQRGGLRWGADVVACRCVAGTRTDLNSPGSFGAPIPPSHLRRLMASDRATLQVHHPQRFNDEAWRLVAALERDCGCLIGSNTYLTPGAGAQGLAPHWDDVDVWVVQVEGCKRWRVYGRTAGNMHALAPSGDLSPGSPFLQGVAVDLECVLHPGDVLYVPRGAVHEAATVGDVPSNHLTVSAFQRWTRKDLARAALEVAVGGDPCALPYGGGCEASDFSRWRRGLPPGAIYTAGFGAACLGHPQPRPTGGNAKSLPADVAALLRAVADDLDARPSGVLDLAWDVLAADFYASRIQPFPSQVAPASRAPIVGCAIACRAPGCFRLHSKMNVEEGGASRVELQSCLENSRTAHMCGGGGDEGSESEESESDESDGSDSSDDDGGGADGAAFPYADRFHLAAALAATRAAPLRVVAAGDNGGKGGAEGGAITIIPHRLAMALWDVGAVCVVGE